MTLSLSANTWPSLGNYCNIRSPLASLQFFRFEDDCRLHDLRHMAHLDWPFSIHVILLAATVVGLVDSLMVT